MDQSELSIATIRALGIDMINKANSGHPGMVLGSAPALYSLFTKELKVYPKESEWFNRDRFVLASGHASSLLYSLLHLSGFQLSMDDLKQFRQWGSCTPGHPEIDTDGVDASSGPLGQGIPMAIGMAMAERYLANRYNKEGFEIIDHYTYTLCGDGDMQEGVTYEAASLAGHLALGKLIVLYDSNHVTLDGPLDYSFSEDVKKRFEAMNWQVILVKDGNDIQAIQKAIKKGKKEKFKPTLIIIDTIIGYGSKFQGTNQVHGAPLGIEDGKYAKMSYGFDYEKDFYVPDEVYDDFQKSVYQRGKRAFNKWKKLMKEYQLNYQDLYQELSHCIAGQYNFNYDEFIKNFLEGLSEATRNSSEKIINEIAKQNPTFLSGTADLASSTKTEIKNGLRFSCENYGGRNLYFGIREFAMVAIMNGMTLHKGIKVAAGGFLVFSDYFKAALRMASLMKLPIILPLSHDSIAVGEDGPTHQPVEQLPMMRSMINVNVLRPADAYETCAAWKKALETNDCPTAIILTRQNVTNITHATYDDVCHGAYIVSPEQNQLDGIIIATGSEVELAIKAQKELLAKGQNVRIVSMPSMELFDAQSDEYKEKILPSHVRKRLAVEMGTDFGWYKYVGLDGRVISVHEYGKSAPAKVVIKNYGFTVEHLVETFLSM